MNGLRKKWKRNMYFFSFRQVALQSFLRKLQPCAHSFTSVICRQNLSSYHHNQVIEKSDKIADKDYAA